MQFLDHLVDLVKSKAISRDVLDHDNVAFNLGDESTLRDSHAATLDHLRWLSIVDWRRHILHDHRLSISSVINHLNL